MLHKWRQQPETPNPTPETYLHLAFGSTSAIAFSRLDLQACKDSFCLLASFSWSDNSFTDFSSALNIFSTQHLYSSLQIGKSKVGSSSQVSGGQASLMLLVIPCFCFCCVGVLPSWAQGTH